MTLMRLIAVKSFKRLTALQSI